MRTRVLVGARRQLLRAGVVTGALVASAGFASAASATPSITVNQACYVVHGKQLPTAVVTGTGFVPGDPVDLSSGNNAFFDANTTVGADGSFVASGQIAPAKVTLVPQTTTITAQDFADTGTVSAVTNATTTFFGVSLVSKKKAPGLRAFKLKGTWTFDGFNPGQEIYGHYLIHHKQVALAKFGKASGPCGYLQVRKDGYPATPHYRNYPVQFDSAKKYSKGTSPKIATILRLHTLF